MPQAVSNNAGMADQIHAFQHRLLDQARSYAESHRTWPGRRGGRYFGEAKNAVADLQPKPLVTWPPKARSQITGSNL